MTILPIFIFCIFTSFVFNIPTLFVQDRLTPGDAGGNLYVIDAVLRGEIPYKDFWWNYGFLPLYYNALFFKIFGSNIHSAILGRLILKSLFSGIFFLALKRIMPVFGAFVATLYFSVFLPEFVHNFSHYAGVCMEIGIAWALLSYCQNAQDKYIFWTWFYVLLLGFIKINFGLLFSLGNFFCLVLCDYFNHQRLSLQRFLQHVAFFVTTLAIFAFIYFIFIQGIPIHEAKQCFPVFKDYRYCGDGCATSDGLLNLYKTSLLAIQQNLFDAIIAFLAFLASIRLIIHMIVNRTVMVKPGRNFLLICGLFLILILCGFHEFIKGGADYQLFWARALTIMMLAYLIVEACLISGRFVQIIVFSVISLLIIIQACQHWNYLEKYHNENHFFKSKHMNICVTEAEKDINSMKLTVDYINNHLTHQELFFTFPHSALYYYLTEHQMPYWLFCLYKAINITPSQQLDLIRTLQQKNVNYIVISSVAYAGGIWGTFGKDYGFEFSQYIKDNFREVARFGEWNNYDPTIYIGGMGTIILKKKNI